MLRVVFSIFISTPVPWHRMEVALPGDCRVLMKKKVSVGFLFLSISRLSHFIQTLGCGPVLIYHVGNIFFLVLLTGFMSKVVPPEGPRFPCSPWAVGMGEALESQLLLQTKLNHCC